MKRLGVLGGVIVFALMTVGAGVAGATATLDKQSVPGNTNVDLVLEVSVEELVGYNQKIVMAVPEGFDVLACTAPAGYTCTKAAAANPTRTVVTWNNTSPQPNEFGLTPTVRFPFRLRTISTSGDYKFDVEQTYSNGASTQWKGAKGSANPAPILTVTGTAAPVSNTTVPNDAPTTSDTTPSSAPSFDFGSTTNTTISFGDVSTPTTVGGDTTATTVAGDTTDTTVSGLAADLVSTGDGDKGIRGVEKVVLIGLGVVAVGSAAFASWRQRSV